jgi:TRAP-type C4-dicarboxylate transport system permease small subunit
VRCPVCGCDFEGRAVEACPECGGKPPSSGVFLKAISIVEDTVISTILIGMVLLVLTQILLRNFYATGVSGGAEMVRHMVLWVAFLGAGIAARERKHIKIDIFQRIFHTGVLRNLSEFMAELFTTGICSILLYASIQFVINDYTSETIIPFLSLCIPIWILELIIPIGYAAVTLRYAAYTIQSLLKVVKRGAQS